MMEEIRPADQYVMKLIEFSIKLLGFWPTKVTFYKKLSNFGTGYAIGMSAWAVVMSSIICLHSLDDFQALALGCVNTSIVSIALWKIVNFTYERQGFLELVSFVYKNFWWKTYHDDEARIMKQCLKKSGIYIVFIVVACHMTLFMYFILPLINNRGKNESDRELPFAWYVDFPIHMTPWYEIIFASQFVAVTYCGYIYFCFDIFLTAMNLTLVGEFMILGDELKDICESDELEKSSVKYEQEIYNNFTKCVRRHQLLIKCADELKELYKNCVISFVVILSILICMGAFQIMTITKILPRIHAVIYTTNATVELFIFTLTCDSLSEASLGICDAAYDVRWFRMRSNVMMMKLLTGLKFVMVRSQVPSQMTVGNFQPVTLQTFTSICNLSFSFLALVRQSNG